MSNTPPRFTFASFAHSFAKAPLVLRSFLLFALASSIYHFSITFAPMPIKMALLPHTGTGLSGYTVSLLFAVYLIYYKIWKMRWGIFFSLLLICAFGLVDILIQQPDLSQAYLEAVPYKKASVWRPLWTIFIPLAWLIILQSKPVKVYCGVLPKTKMAT